MPKTRFEPKAYQRAAIDWVTNHARCCLFLEMGLGKTVSTLTAIQRLIDCGDVERVLVVAPRKVADSTWQDEAAKWLHLSLRVTSVEGTAGRRAAALATESDVWVTGRDTLAWLTEQKDAPRFDMIVFDELTSFKNHRATRTKAALRLSRAASRVVGLTGTPTPQGMIDLWSQLMVIDHGERLGTSLTRYRNAYFTYYERNHIIYNLKPKPGTRETIERLLGDICLTMRKDDYNPLPPLRVRDVRVTLPAERMKAYQEFERDKVLELEEAEETTAITAASAAAVLGKLMQYTGGAVYDEDGEWHTVGSEKLSKLREEVERDTSPVIIFYQFKHESRRILETIQGARLYESADDLQAWNSGEVRALVCHPASTAYGLNLQYGGHRMIWYSMTWSLEQYEQAIARLHRQGQRHEVECVRLVCPGTVDERVIEALTTKGNGQRALMVALSKTVKAVAKEK